MTHKRLATAMALAALAPFLAACGGGGSNAAQPLPSKPPTLTVPGSAKAPKVNNTAADTTTTTGTSTTTTAPVTTTPTQTTAVQSNPSTPQGGAAPPSTGGAAPSGGATPTSTTPSPSTPAGKFEQFCKENPGAC